MTLEVIELILIAVGLIITVGGIVYQQRKSQEKAMQATFASMQQQIDTLKAEKVDEVDMKEYVQLWTAPIAQSLDHLTEETKRTRELMEKLYSEGRNQR